MNHQLRVSKGSGGKLCQAHGSRTPRECTADVRRKFQIDSRTFAQLTAEAWKPESAKNSERLQPF